MNDKLIGLVMIFGSFGVIAFMLVWTILFPILKGEEFLLKAYLAVAIVIFISVFILMLLTAWIGWTFLKTRAPKEGMLGEEIEE
jgi:hypothetical protein